jgi:hypothetical protein
MNDDRVIALRAFSVACAAAACAWSAPAAAAPASGDTYVYRLVNGYSKEVRGQLRHRVDRVDPESITVAVTPDNAQAGFEHTTVFTKDGNSMRRLMESHGQKVDYLVSTAYPAYVFPLEPGKTWSLRVNASVPGAAGVRSVRVDGKVLGTERIRVPAGEFDTVKVRRLVYPGDAYYHLPETKIIETDWYAPALGRSVRTETRSEFFDLSRCDALSSCVYYGDWDVVELVDAGAARK